MECVAPTIFSRTSINRSTSLTSRIISACTASDWRHVFSTTFSIGRKVGVLAALSKLIYGFSPSAVGT